MMPDYLALADSLFCSTAHHLHRISQRVPDQRRDMPCSNTKSGTNRVISPPDLLALAITRRENDSTLGFAKLMSRSTNTLPEDLLLFSSFARHYFANKGPTVDVGVCVWQHGIWQYVKMHMMDNRLGHGCGLEDCLTAVYKRTARSRVRSSLCTSTVSTSILQCFFQSSPPRLLLHSLHFPMHFQHPPTMWYMRNAADPLVGHQCRVLSPIAALHFRSALA